MFFYLIKRINSLLIYELWWNVEIFHTLPSHPLERQAHKLIVPLPHYCPQKSQIQHTALKSAEVVIVSAFSQSIHKSPTRSRRSEYAWEWTTEFHEACWGEYRLMRWLQRLRNPHHHRMLWWCDLAWVWRTADKLAKAFFYALEGRDSAESSEDQ